MKDTAQLTDAEGKALVVADVAAAAASSRDRDDNSSSPPSGEEEVGRSRSSKRMAEGTSSKKSPAPTSSNLLLLLQRRGVLASELRAIDEQIRQARANGEVEPDSLLAVDGDFLPLMMKYLDAPSLAKSEMVCKRFRQLAPPRWKEMDGFKEEVAPGSSRVGTSLRMKAIRHMLASNFAKEMEALTPAHTPELPYDQLGLPTIQCSGCTGKTPWRLDAQFYNERAELEFFVRCSNKHTGAVLAQGFVESDCRPEYTDHCDEIACDRPHAFETRLRIKDLDLSGWPGIAALCPVPDGMADHGSDLFRRMRKVLGETSVTVVAMRRDSTTPADLKLVAASCEPHGRHGIYYDCIFPPGDFCMEFMIPDPHVTRENSMYSRSGRHGRPGYRNWSGINFMLDGERCMMLRLSKDYDTGAPL